jgi:endonuclease YncB( thermonuclease family)
LIREGYARAQLSEISDEKLRKEYEAAELDAKQGRQGIWSDAPVEGKSTPLRKSE